MAITKNVFTESAGYSKADLIDQMESALAWGGVHGPGISGLIVSLDSYSGGSTIAGAANTNYMDVSATGGTGCSERRVPCITSVLPSEPDSVGCGSFLYQHPIS